MTVLIALLIVMIVAWIVLLILYKKQKKRYRQMRERQEEEILWYTSMLDTIPYPISVTDMDGNWTFVNKTVETLFNKPKDEFIGKQCHEWGTKICKTPQCGIECLERGEKNTFFEQAGSDYKVLMEYLYDKSGNKVGHIEVVEEISDMMEIQKKQNDLIYEVNEACGNLFEYTEKSDANVKKLALGTDEQTAAIEELVATVNQIDGQTKDNAEAIKQTTKKTYQAGQEIERCNQQMVDLTEAMKEIDETSKQVNMIITSIEDIASQTNLLSLNASIEAARAGEAGRGFAVVADQIGKLASQSTEAAKNTKELIETTISAINKGDEIARSAAVALEMVVVSMKEIQNYSTEVSGAIIKESEAISQVNQTLEQVASVVQENATVATDNSKTSRELIEQVEQLKELVEPKE